jgi:O-Antigen ligase
MSRKRRRKKASPDRTPEVRSDDRLPFAFILIVAITAVMPLVAGQLTTFEPDDDSLSGVTGLIWFAAVILAAFCLALLDGLRHGVLHVPRTGLWIGIGLLAVGVVLSAALAGDRYRSLVGAVQAILGLLYLATILLTVRGRNRVRWLLAALVAGAFAAAAMSLYNHFSISTEHMMAYYEEYGSQVVSPGDTMKDVMFRRRIEGDFISVFYHPNLMASYMALGLLVTLGLVIGHLRGTVHQRAPFETGDASAVRAASEHLASTWRQRPQSLTGSILIAVCGAAMVVGLVMTQGRAGILAALTGAYVMLVLGFARTRRAKIGLIVGPALLVGALAVLALQKGWLGEAAVSLRFRWQYWQGAWSVVTEHPWIGVGPGNFGGHYLAHKLAEAHEEIHHPHNALLWAWAEAGLAALAGLVALIAFGFREASRHMVAVAEQPLTDLQMKRPLILVAVICGLLVAAFNPAGVGSGNLVGPALLIVLSMLSLSLPFLGVLILGREADQALWNIGRRWIRLGLVGAAVAFWLQSMTSLSVPHLPTACAAYAVLGLLVATGQGRHDFVWTVPQRRRSQVAAIVLALVLLYVGLVVWPVIGGHWALVDSRYYAPWQAGRRECLETAAQRCPPWSAPHSAMADDQIVVANNEWASHEALIARINAVGADTPEGRRLSAQAHAAREAARTAYHRALAHIERACALGPRALGPRRRAVAVCRILADRFGEAERQAEGLEHLRQAVAIAPVKAMLRAEVAAMLLEADQSDAAGRQALEAIRLDDLMTDPLRKLSPRRRARSEQIARKHGP